MKSKGEMWVFDSSCITKLQIQIMTDSIAHYCIVLCSHIKANEFISVTDCA